MKVLVSTRRGQGQRESDFFDGLEGELVFFSLELACPIDRDCGCRRSLTGMSGSSTTFEVADKPISREEYVAELKASMIYSGRFKSEDLDEKSLRKGLKGAGMGSENIDSFLADYFPNAEVEAEALLSYAAKFPVGTVLEKRGDELFPRIIEHSDAERIRDLIEQGESTTVELKETFSLCNKKLTKESYMEISSLKTIAGFLNSKGGSLLVGVADSGDIVGVNREIEKFHANNTDKFLLHFKNLLKSKIGESFYPFINHRLIKLEQVFVLLVECADSPTPCYLDRKDFYVRTNPATDKLEGPEMVDYINHHWKR